jgi:integrase
MSVHPTPTGGHRVRWREGGRLRSRTFSRLRDAERFDRHVQRELELRGVGFELDRQATTLAELRAEWRASIGETKARSTREGYDAVWRAHLEERVGSVDVRALTSERCELLAAELELAGVGQSSRAKTLAHLSGLLRFALVRRQIAYHPMRDVVKIPQTRRKRLCEPPGPEQVWRLVDRLRARSDPQGAILTLLVAFAGLRPGEALALDWRQVGKRSLRIEGAIAFGERKGTKTEKTRTVELLPALERELVSYRLDCGLPASGLLFADEGGRPWTDTRYRNWRRRSFSVAATEVGWFDAVPYDLRHAFASLLLHEGRSVVEVAAQLGHSVAVCQGTYAHVIPELAGARRVRSSTAVERARRATRGSDVPSVFPRAEGEVAGE